MLNATSRAAKTGILKGFATGIVLASICFQSPQARAEYPITTQATLLDRIQIEDLMMQYMVALEARDPEKYAAVFAEDGVLDVNGKIYTGRAAIRDFMKGVIRPDHKRWPVHHDIVNDPMIVIDGDKASIHAVWTVYYDDTVKLAPRPGEQGRYVDEVVKVQGRWLFKRRAVISDAGLPDEYDKTYTER